MPRCLHRHHPDHPSISAQIRKLCLHHSHHFASVVFFQCSTQCYTFRRFHLRLNQKPLLLRPVKLESPHMRTLVHGFLPIVGPLLCPKLSKAAVPLLDHRNLLRGYDSSLPLVVDVPPRLLRYPPPPDQDYELTFQGLLRPDYPQPPQIFL